MWCERVHPPVRSAALSEVIPSQRFLKGMCAARDDMVTDIGVILYPFPSVQPAMRITVPQTPWPSSSDAVCRLAATNAQLAELHRKVLGIE